jgi:hypothetical protein
MLTSAPAEQAGQPSAVRLALLGSLIATDQIPAALKASPST